MLDSNISSIFSLSITVSLSRITSFLSMEITSPVSSSTKSSYQELRTLAASFLPIIFFKAAFETLTSSARSNISKISLSLSYPIVLNNVVTGSFFFLSMYAYITPFISDENSIHEPLNGITLAEYNLVPFAWND